MRLGLEHKEVVVVDGPEDEYMVVDDVQLVCRSAGVHFGKNGVLGGMEGEKQRRRKSRESE
jgi:hypothetical protein